MKNQNQPTIRIFNREIKREDLWITGLLIILLWVFFSFRMNLKGIGFERDEGVYSYYGHLLLKGKIPYKDFYEQKFPGIFYFYAAMIKIFGYGVEELHRGFAWLNLLSITLIFFSVRLLINAFAGLVAALAYGIYSFNPYISGYTIQSEHGVAFFTCLGFFLYVLFRKSQQKKSLLSFLMGMSMGMAFMTKTSGIMFLGWLGLVLLLEYFVFPSSRDFKKGLLYTVLYGSGALLVIGFFFLLIYSKGAFKDMIYWAYITPKKYVGQVTWKEGKMFLAYNWKAVSSSSGWFWNIPLITLPLILFIAKERFQDKIYVILFALFSFLAIVPGFYFYGHYWIQLAPAVAVLHGFFVKTVMDFSQHIVKLKFPYPHHVVLVVMIVLALMHVQARNRDFFGYYSSHANYTMILRQVYGENPFPECVEIARFLRERCKPEDQFIVVGSEPQIYVYTGKDCPSRHAYFAAIVNNVPEHKAWQREFASDIEKSRPRFIIFFNHRISLLVQPNTDNYIFTWLNDYVGKNYHLVGLADMISGMPTQYVYDAALQQYKVSGQHQIYIYERNS